MKTLCEIFYDEIDVLVRKVSAMTVFSEQELKQFKKKQAEMQSQLNAEFRERYKLSRVGVDELKKLCKLSLVGLGELESESEFRLKVKTFRESAIIMNTFYEYNYLSNKLQYLEDLLNDDIVDIPF